MVCWISRLTMSASVPGMCGVTMPVGTPVSRKGSDHPVGGTTLSGMTRYTIDRRHRGLRAGDRHI